MAVYTGSQLHFFDPDSSLGCRVTSARRLARKRITKQVMHILYAYTHNTPMMRIELPSTLDLLLLRLRLSAQRSRPGRHSFPWGCASCSSSRSSGGRVGDRPLHGIVTRLVMNE